jgi:hypothetical protein
MDIPLFARGDDGPCDHPSGITHPRAEGVTRPAGDPWVGWNSPAWPDSSENETTANEAEPIDPDAEEMEKLMNLRRRPSKLADALTRKAYRDYNKVQAGPSVKWIAKADSMTAALDEAEASGKKQA